MTTFAEAMRKAIAVEQARLFSILVAAIGGSACSEAIPLPAPQELAAAQIGFGSAPTVELSWRVVVRIDGYRVHYGEGPGDAYAGRGLRLLSWPEGCGDFDAGALYTFSGDAGADLDATAEIDADAYAPGDAAGDAPRDARQDTRGDAAEDALVDRGEPGPSDASPQDAQAGDLLATGVTADSPIEIPAVWCMETEATEAGPAPVQTPGKRPRVRLQGLQPGETYRFAVTVFRRDVESALSAPAQIVASATAP